jgi:hypothetical protein
MAKLSEIEADLALKSLLTGKIATDKDVLKVYGQYEQPNSGLDDDFIRIYYNGNIRSRTYPIGVFDGNLALQLFCKCNNDGTAKRNRIRRLLAEVETYVDRKRNQGYTFKLSATPITPVTVDTTTGYSTTTLNIEWHT